MKTTIATLLLGAQNLTLGASLVLYYIGESIPAATNFAVAFGCSAAIILSVRKSGTST